MFCWGVNLHPCRFYFYTLLCVVIFDPSEYRSSVKNKILELRELVNANIVESADHQQLTRHNSVAGIKLRNRQEVFQDSTTKESLTLNG